jgi:predicted ribosome quality control (RQC) complex YloA/Tae2 family protein
MPIAKSIAALDIRKLIEELSFLNGGIVRNAKSRKNELYLLIFAGTEYWLKIVPGKYICVSKNKPEDTIEFPFTLKLKSIFDGKRIALSMHKSDRIIEIAADNSRMIIELFSKGNVIIVEDKVISFALFTRNYGTRVISSGKQFDYPPEALDTFNLSSTDFERYLSASDKDNIAKALAVDFGLGGVYAEEICYRVGLNKDASPKDLNVSDISKLYNTLKSLIDEKPDPNIVDDKFLSITELKSISGEKRHFKTINEAICEFFRIDEKKKTSALRPSDIASRLMTTERLINYIKENYGEITDAIKIARNSEISLDSRIKDLDVIGWALNGKFILRKDNYDVRIDITRPLNKVISEYYEKAKRLKKAMSERRDLRPPLKKLPFRVTEAWYSKYRWFFTRSKKLVVIGRDNGQNVSLIEKHLDKNDIIVHADIFGSPFAVIKADQNKDVTANDIEEAATMVASYSSAWKAGAGNIDVYWVKPEQVTKTPPSGESLKKGAFYIEGKKEFLKKVETGIYIGFDYDDAEYSLVALPYEPAGSFVLLRPGNKERKIVVNKITENIAENARVLINRDLLDRLIPTGKASIAKLQIIQG